MFVMFYPLRSLESNISCIYYLEYNLIFQRNLKPATLVTFYREMKSFTDFLKSLDFAKVTWLNSLALDKDRTYILHTSNMTILLLSTKMFSRTLNCFFALFQNNIVGKRDFSLVIKELLSRNFRVLILHTSAFNYLATILYLYMWCWFDLSLGFNFYPVIGNFQFDKLRWILFALE